MIVVIFGNMVGDAFLSAMVVTREFGLIGELFHMVKFSKAQSLDEMLVEKADHHYKTCIGRLQR